MELTVTRVPQRYEAAVFCSAENTILHESEKVQAIHLTTMVNLTGNMPI